MRAEANMAHRHAAGRATRKAPSHALLRRPPLPNRNKYDKKVKDHRRERHCAPRTGTHRPARQAEGWQRLSWRGGRIAAPLARRSAFSGLWKYTGCILLFVTEAPATGWR